VLGVPIGVTACLFDLDGVLTQTAKVHSAAWKQMFDDYLRKRARRTGEAFVAFDPIREYDQYVDGRPRDDGVRAFLASRGVELPEGDPDNTPGAELPEGDPDNTPGMELPEGDPDETPGTETIHSLGNRKNEIVLRLIREQGVQPYEGSVRYVKAVQAAGLRRAVVSSSTNCRDVLAAAGIEDLFEEVIDGVVAQREQLQGKPAPDTFLAGARALGVEPAEAVVFEDALAGVEAGRAGRFGFVVGVDRVGQAEALRAHGADLVVDDLAKLLPTP
jgi:beta-phosphoglucomutase family hydrolase